MSVPLPSASTPRAPAAALLALAVLALSGCASGFGDRIESRPSEPAGAGSGGSETSRTGSLARLQQEMMDFSDRFVSDIWQALDVYIAQEPEATKQVKAQRLKVVLATSAMTIASSRDPRANLLDMAVFVSAGKWAADRYWIPKMLGPKADALGRAYARLEREIRAQADAVLTPAQSADLGSLIAAWKSGAPDPREAMDVRLRHLEGVVLSDFQEVSSAKGLLASVRRLLGNVDQSLLYGERMMFYVERLPLILSQQADLTVDRVAERFPIATVNPDFSQWADLANALPKQVGEIFESRSQVVREVMPQVQGSLQSLDRIAQSLQGTVIAADSLAAKVQQLPFKPEDYSAALDGTTTSLNKLNEIVVNLNRLLDEDAKGSGKENRLTQLTRLLDERADRTLDAVFYRAAMLIALLIGGLLLVVIVARVSFRRAPAPVAKKDA